MVAMGWLPDPPDDRDKNAHDVLALTSVPDSFSLRDKVLQVLDQGSIGACVSNAGMQAIRVKTQEDLGSRLWGYYLARTYHGAEKQDRGTHIRFFFKAMNKFGFLPESDLEYNTSRYDKKPPMLSFRDAFDQREPTRYWRIFSHGEVRLEEIRRAVSQGHPVVFGTDVDRDFTGNRISALVERPQGNIAGGHAMVIVGYDRDGFEVVNSWGRAWGQKGFFRMSNDYLSWENTRDIWVVERAPRFSK